LPAAKLRLIPVIDLKGGIVVHAREGRRSEYAPIQSNLCKGADPQTVMAALVQLHPFRIFYFADLDAIQREGSNRTILAGLHARFPDIDIWADTGIADETALDEWRRAGLGTSVIGSESLVDVNLIAGARNEPAVLSLDFLGDTFKGPPELLRDPALWPADVLAMNLQRVGSDAGPDLALISMLAAKQPASRVYAAGGVRSIEDLRRAGAAGAAGALLATALHDGRIGRAELRSFGETVPSKK
jgi:phosphoribosylformimino-5-aminoimidazole carboxamide ribotide isomerase